MNKSLIALLTLTSICDPNGIQIEKECLEEMNQNIPIYQEFHYMDCIALYTDMFIQCDDMNIQELLCAYEYCNTYPYYPPTH